MRADEIAITGFPARWGNWLSGNTTRADPGKVGIGEVGIGKVGTGKVGMRADEMAIITEDPGRREGGAPEVRIQIFIGSDAPGPDPGEVGTCEVCVSKAGPTEVGLEEVGIGEVYSSEVGPGEVGPVEDNPGEINRWKILIGPGIAEVGMRADEIAALEDPLAIMNVIRRNGMREIGDREIYWRSDNATGYDPAEFGVSTKGDPIAIGSGEGGLGAVGAREIGPVEEGIAEVGPGAVGTPVGPRPTVKECPAEVGMEELGTGKVGSARLQPLPCRSPRSEVGSVEVGIAEVGPRKVDPFEIFPMKVGPLKVGTRADEIALSFVFMKHSTYEMPLIWEREPSFVGDAVAVAVDSNATGADPFKDRSAEVGPGKVGPVEVGICEVGSRADEIVIRDDPASWESRWLSGNATGADPGEICSAEVDPAEVDPAGEICSAKLCPVEIGTRADEIATGEGPALWER